ncbi:MAG: aldehyde dehydrogenase family protein [Pseudorhodobacter sp.]
MGNTAIRTLPEPDTVLPKNRGLYFGGAWHEAGGGRTFEGFSPGNGSSLGMVADATEEDVSAAIAAAHAAFPDWAGTAPLERARILRELAAIIRANATELALLDAIDCGNPVRAMTGDAAIATAQIELFAGFVTEMKGASIPMGPGRLNVSVREPLGVVARISPFNHPFMFAAAKIAAPLAAGNTVLIKPPEQAPLSALRLAELAGHLFPPGVFNVITGSSRDVGAWMVADPRVAKTGLIGSVAAGRAVMQASAALLKPVLLELGGKNALIAFADTDPEAVAQAMIAGMNFAWCGQSCGSTSRAFLHEDIHDEVLGHLARQIGAFRPGPPERWETSMGALASKAQFERTLRYIDIGKAEGATLFSGGKQPEGDGLENGYFVEPTVFTDVTTDMVIAREEIFGPVLSVLRWRDEKTMLADVNALDLGLTCSIWTRNFDTALRVATSVEAGYVWVNEVSRHFVGAPFGGKKQSGLGREECIEEMLSFTELKNIHMRFGN